MSTLYKLLLLPALFFAQALAAQIYEVQLEIDRMSCPYCAKALSLDIKTINGVENVKIWPGDGLALVDWKTDIPFQLSLLNRVFERSDFTLKRITIDVEGVIERRRGALTLRSEPDNSIFYIVNPEARRVIDLQEGQQVRLRGLVRSQQGLNMLTVVDVMPPV